MRVKLRPGSPDAEGLWLPPSVCSTLLKGNSTLTVSLKGLITGLVGTDPGDRLTL